MYCNWKASKTYCLVSKSLLTMDKGDTFMNPVSDTLSMKHKLIYLMLSIVMNAMGNGITVALNLGSAMWTASAVNISKYTGYPLAWIMIILGTFTILVNGWITKEWNVKRIIGNYLFMVLFSFLVGLFAQFFVYLGMASLPYFVRMGLDIGGIFLLACGVSLYQRLHLVIHPIDEYMNSIRYYLCRGHATLGQWVSFLPPIVLTFVMVWITKQLYAVHIGTLVSLLFQGAFTGWADRHIFPSIQRYKLESNETDNYTIVGETIYDDISDK